MAKLQLFLILLLLPLTLRSQEEIHIGKKQFLYSVVLQEERNYWVHLPEEYDQNPEQTYPVIYLLDGESFFHSLVGISKTLSLGRGRHLPPGIIVGVISTDRTRDLTPTASAAGRDGQIAPGATLQGGGSEAFNRFLTEELRATIDSNYRTNRQNILIGHSYAGLFTLHTLLHHTEQFDIYLAVDPSLWWDQGKLSEEADTHIKKKDFTGKSLYIGIASKKRTDRTDIHLNKVNHLLTEVLPQAANLRFYSKLFPEESHGTIAIPGLYDGIKQLFGK